VEAENSFLGDVIQVSATFSAMRPIRESDPV
jgi:hypothetical protein